MRTFFSKVLATMNAQPALAVIVYALSFCLMVFASTYDFMTPAILVLAPLGLGIGVIMGDNALFNLNYEQAKKKLRLRRLTIVLGTLVGFLISVIVLPVTVLSLAVALFILIFAYGGYDYAYHEELGYKRSDEKADPPKKKRRNEPENCGETRPKGTLRNIEFLNDEEVEEYLSSSEREKVVYEHLAQVRILKARCTMPREQEYIVRWEELLMTQVIPQRQVIAEYYHALIRDTLPRYIELFERHFAATQQPSTGLLSMEKVLESQVQLALDKKQSFEDELNRVHERFWVLYEQHTLLFDNYPLAQRILNSLIDEPRHPKLIDAFKELESYVKNVEESRSKNIFENSKKEGS